MQMSVELPFHGFCSNQPPPPPTRPLCRFLGPQQGHCRATHGPLRVLADPRRQFAVHLPAVCEVSANCFNWLVAGELTQMTCAEPHVFKRPEPGILPFSSLLFPSQRYALYSGSGQTQSYWQMCSCCFSFIYLFICWFVFTNSAFILQI